jgi:hypothetical protein
MASVPGVSMENDQGYRLPGRPITGKEGQAISRRELHGFDPAIFWIVRQSDASGVREILQFSLEEIDKAHKDQVKHRQISEQTPKEMTYWHVRILCETGILREYFFYCPLS